MVSGLRWPFLFGIIAQSDGWTGNITSSGIEAGEKNFNESKAGEAKLEAFTKLTKILLDSKRYEDLDRATKDIEYQKKLMKDYNITD